MQKKPIEERNFNIRESQIVIGCSKCAYYESMMDKYAKLEALLNKKINQLTKKLSDGGQFEWNEREEEKTSSTFKKSQKTDDKGSEIKQFEPQAHLQETDQKVNEIVFEEVKIEPTSESLQRYTSLIDSLTEQVMQLKTNFMHIRQCVYSLFQESKMWKFIQKNQMSINVSMVLFNIFEYSQQERQQMCRVRKVKIKTLRKEESKQNQMYRTVKDIC